MKILFLFTSLFALFSNPVLAESAVSKNSNKLPSGEQVAININSRDVELGFE